MIKITEINQYIEKNTTLKYKNVKASYYLVLSNKDFKIGLIHPGKQIVLFLTLFVVDINIMVDSFIRSIVIQTLLLLARQSCTIAGLFFLCMQHRQ